MRRLRAGRGDKRRVDKTRNGKRCLFGNAQKNTELLTRKTSGHAHYNAICAGLRFDGERVEMRVGEIGEVTETVAGQATCRQRVETQFLPVTAMAFVWMQPRPRLSLRAKHKGFFLDECKTRTNQPNAFGIAESNSVIV